MAEIEYNYDGDTWELTATFDDNYFSQIINRGEKTQTYELELKNVTSVYAWVKGGFANVIDNRYYGRSISVGNTMRCEVFLVNSKTKAIISKGYAEGYARYNGNFYNDASEYNVTYNITDSEKSQYDKLRITYTISPYGGEVTSATMSNFPSRNLLKQAGKAIVTTSGPINIPVTFNSNELTEIKLDNSSVSSLTYNGQTIY